MRRFHFTLKLRDGRIVQADALAKQWEWSVAFAEACTRVEKRLGIEPWSGITCVAYSSVRVPDVTPMSSGPAPALRSAA